MVEVDGASKDQIDVVYQGFDFSLFEPEPEQITAVRTEFALHDHFSVGCVGRLFPTKGHIYLVEAIARLVAQPVTWLAALTRPFVLLLSGSTKAVLRLLGVKERSNNVTEEEIHAAALSDPDAQPWTPEQLARSRRVVDVRLIRERHCLSQEEFARRFGLKLEMVRGWEDRTLVPDSTAVTLLRVIWAEPETVRRVVAAE